MNVDIDARRALPSEQRMAACGFWAVVLPSGLKPTQWPHFPFRDLLARRRQRLARSSSSDVIVTDLPNDSRVVLADVDVGKSQFELLTASRTLIGKLLEHAPPEIGIMIAGFDTVAAERISEALIAATLAAAAVFPDYRSQKKRTKTTELERVLIFGSNPRHKFRRTLAEAQGSNLARYLAMLPSNELTPASYRHRLSELARSNKWRMDVIGMDQLAKRGAGAFLAVAQASPDKDAAIVRLRYKTGRCKAQVEFGG